MGFHARRHKAGQLFAFRINHLLGQVHAQYVGEQLDGSRHVRSVQQAVVKAGRFHPFQVARPGFRVAVAHAPLAGLLLGSEQFEAMTGRHSEGDAATAVLQVTGCDLFGGNTGRLQVGTESIQCGLIQTFETDKIHPRLIRFTQYQRELVDFGPALEVDTALSVTIRLDHAKQVNVVFQSFIHIQHTQLNMAGTHYTFFHSRYLIVVSLLDLPYHSWWQSRADQVR